MVAQVLHHMHPHDGIRRWTAMLDKDLARNMTNRSILGAFNPGALAMTESEITGI